MKILFLADRLKILSHRCIYIRERCTSVDDHCERLAFHIHPNGLGPHDIYQRVRCTFESRLFLCLERDLLILIIKDHTVLREDVHSQKGGE